MNSKDRIVKLVSEIQSGTHCAEAIADMTAIVHSELLELHSRALAAHCECLGMNAENSWAVCQNTVPPYNFRHYNEVMLKWGLVDEKGNSS